ncbi:hypothetical protein AOQ84DRAFT_81177 [Glonium stellatum]|uniref:Uncharacterized protein n=1 Tax=Glonium stellatum TaxID=574774 RepID=A0A8E2JQU3_9PEZI|nr:hypothetical protein AOQ84DRAFT_81177 [Glonium stellatum]
MTAMCSPAPWATGQRGRGRGKQRRGPGPSLRQTLHWLRAAVRLLIGALPSRLSSAGLLLCTAPISPPPSLPLLLLSPRCCCPRPTLPHCSCGPLHSCQHGELSAHAASAQPLPLWNSTVAPRPTADEAEAMRRQ